MEKLALFGGEKVKATPFGTGKRFGNEELEQVKEALEQNTLFYWFGEKVKELNRRFAGLYGVDYCVATSSGTAAIHVALGALGITADDEVITSPITDMGTVIGILYQNAIPVFADVDPYTYNLDPKSIEERITKKTKVIIVVHLAGNAADMDAIMAIAKKHNIYVLEDCAQSYMSYYKGRLVGTIGDAGCFSLNDFKQISAGDGGMVLVKTPELYGKALKFADKNYNRLSKDTAQMRKIDFIAPNYRMNELTGAVGIAQIGKLEWICERRHSFCERLSEKITGLCGLSIPKIVEGNKSSYWFYMLRIDEKNAGVSRDDFSKALEAEGIPNQPGYIPTCIYEYDMFKNKSAYLGTNYPFKADTDYCKGMCPVAEEVLATAIRINISEFYTDEDCEQISRAIRKVLAYYRRGS